MFKNLLEILAKLSAIFLLISSCWIALWYAKPTIVQFIAALLVENFFLACGLILLSIIGIDFSAVTLKNKIQMRNVGAKSRQHHALTEEEDFE